MDTAITADKWWGEQLNATTGADKPTQQIAPCYSLLLTISRGAMNKSTNIFAWPYALSLSSLRHVDDQTGHGTEL